MRPFEYSAPRSLDEAVAIFGKTGSTARPLAGGTDLIVQLREGRKTCDLVVDIKKIPELMALSFDYHAGLTLGAAVPCARIYEDPTVVERYPGLVDAASLIGGIQIQNRASLGGNLCNASPAADGIPPLIVHRAVCVVAGAEGTRTLPAESFCSGPGETALRDDEFLVGLRLPAPPPCFGAKYLRFVPRNEMDIAVAGAACSLELDDDRRTIRAARVALAAVAPTPLLVSEAGEALTGREPTSAVFEEAGRLAAAASRPISDLRGEAWQRRHLAGVLVRRALAGALERARAS